MVQPHLVILHILPLLIFYTLFIYLFQHLFRFSQVDEEELLKAKWV